mmetsp:Transcript_21499/g.43545  ORF Transcript_21499/g.43545 Transcript_21499/m.43545 type:complete len:262 (-) Transcript_21499:120-905(-)
MSQLGCVLAFLRTTSGCSRLSAISSSVAKSRKAPPEAVRMMRRSAPGGTPCRHWKMAECSESAGVILAPYWSSSGRITGPPAISVSLFASAIVRPSLMASMVGSRPAQPTTPVTTVSAPGATATAVCPSEPTTISGSLVMPAARSLSRSSSSLSAAARPTTLGRNSATCAARSSTFEPAESEITSKYSGYSRQMSSVCVPIEPVDPSRAMCLRGLASSARARESLRLPSVSTGAAGSSTACATPARRAELAAPDPEMVASE